MHLNFKKLATRVSVVHLGEIGGRNELVRLCLSSTSTNAEPTQPKVHPARRRQDARARSAAVLSIQLEGRRASQART
jgi:hypothetical protein